MTPNRMRIAAGDPGAHGGATAPNLHVAASAPVQGAKASGADGSHVALLRNANGCADATRPPSEGQA
jgi:hypothetical protein